MPGELAQTARKRGWAGFREVPGEGFPQFRGLAPSGCSPGRETGDGDPQKGRREPGLAALPSSRFWQAKGSGLILGLHPNPFLPELSNLPGCAERLSRAIRWRTGPGRRSSAGSKAGIEAPNDPEAAPSGAACFSAARGLQDMADGPDGAGRLRQRARAQWRQHAVSPRILPTVLRHMVGGSGIAPDAGRPEWRLHSARRLGQTAGRDSCAIIGAASAGPLEPARCPGIPAA